MKHIELNCASLAECYARARELITISDLGHSAKVVIDIDTDSPFDGSWVKVTDTTPVVGEKKDG